VIAANRFLEMQLIGRLCACLLVLMVIVGSTLAQINYTPYQVRTYAGLAGTAGFGDGTGSAARFYGPAGMAIDSSGNLYVADGYANTIRKIAPGGIVTTLAGTGGVSGSSDGAGSAALFSSPVGVAVDTNGNIYVADSANSTVRKITPSGVVTTLAGTPGVIGFADGIGSSAQFDRPYGVAVDSSGNVFVSDLVYCFIRKITPSGVVTSFAGMPIGPGFSDGTGSAAVFAHPNGLAVDANGNVYVADQDNNAIRKITPAGVVTTLTGHYPQKGYADGTGSAATFNRPGGVAVDGSGNVFVADTGNFTIRMITSNGVVTTLAGAAGTQGSSDGRGSTASFNYSGGPAVDGGGNLYVSDGGSSTIRLCAPALPVSINVGSTATFNAVTIGTTSPTFQWQFNGANLADGGNIAGSTGPELVITGATAANAGNYTSIATGSSSLATTNVTGLSIVMDNNPGAVSSISSRAFVGTGNNILIGGFYIAGSSSRTVLIQAIGPALAASPYNVTGTLQQPALTIHQSQNGKDVVLYTNTRWGSSPVLLDAAATVYAQPVLQPGSPDSELLLTLPPGGYTAEVTGADGGTGVALCGIYELP
jgi:streptogramin lyase